MIAVSPQKSEISSNTHTSNDIIAETPMDKLRKKRSKMYPSNLAVYLLSNDWAFWKPGIAWYDCVLSMFLLYAALEDLQTFLPRLCTG